MTAAVQMTEGQFIDELTFRNYSHQRDTAPEITPERWAAIYPNVPAMEARYQRERGKPTEPLVVDLRERLDVVCGICGVKHCHGHPQERGVGR